ncbi:MAG: hypothetical protein QM770_15165 [Tepidisphaeraceae bacterium]
MAFKDDIDIPLCVTVALLVAIVIGIAAIGTEAGYNYVDRRKVYQRYDELQKDDNLVFYKTIKSSQLANIEKPSEDVKEGNAVVGKSLPIDQAIKLVANSKGNPPAVKYPQ